MKKKIFLSKFQKRIFLYYLEFMAFFTFIIMILFFYLVDRERDNIINNQLSLTNTIGTQVEMNLATMNRISLQAAGNSEVKDVFENINKNEETNYFDSHVYELRNIQNALLIINGPDLAVGRISIFNGWLDYVSYGKYYEKSEVIKETLSSEKYNNIMEIFSSPFNYRMVTLQKDNWGDQQVDMLSLYRPLKNTVTGKVSGLIEVQLKAEEFFKNILPEGIYNAYIFDNQGTLIYPYNLDLVQKETAQNYQDIQFDSDTVIIQNMNMGVNEMVTSSIVERYGWKVIITQQNATTLSSISNFLKGVLIIIILSVIGAALAIFIISKKLTEPLTNLLTSVKNVTLNNLTLSIDEEEDLDVVKKLNTAFSKMFQMLHVSIEKEMAANLQAMQAQMNPHFLYNVLAVIDAAGVEEGSNKIPLLCDKLSGMLRYSSSYNEQLVTLEKELAYAEDYCLLMAARYEDSFSYSITRSGPIERISIPKIIIQPIVENCFKHGLFNAECTWNIEIKVCVLEDQWYFSVYDNGIGFSEEKIQELDTYIRKNKNMQLDEKDQEVVHLGLRNTILRLSLACKEEIFYKIENHQNKGVTITIGGIFHD